MLNVSLLGVFEVRRPDDRNGIPAARFEPVTVVVRTARPLEPAVAAPESPVARRRQSAHVPSAIAPAAPITAAAPAVVQAPRAVPSASAPLLLDDATLRHARAAARRGGVGTMAESAGVPLATAPSPDEQRADSVQRAVRPDCRSAHAGKGLFAVPFLLRDAVAGDGCKW